MKALQWVYGRPLSRLGTVSVVLPGTVLAALVGVLGISLAILGNFSDLIVSVLVLALLAIAYQVFVGATGIISFGHMAFVGLGAYFGGLLAVPPEDRQLLLPSLPVILTEIYLPFWGAVVAAAAFCAVIAFITGLVLMRLVGAAASIATLALLVIVTDSIANLDSITNGKQTFFGVPNDATPITVAIVLVVATAIALLYKFSATGLRARGVRDNPIAGETLGVSIVGTRMGAWVVSAALTGAAGTVIAHQLTAFTPSNFFIAASVPVIVVVVLGGTSSVAGSLIAACLFAVWIQFTLVLESGQFLSFTFPQLLGVGQLTIGVGLLVLLRLRPEGLFGSRELGVRFRDPR